MAVAIVLAAGSGSRMQSRVAKQYMKLHNKEVLFYSLDAFNRHPMIDAIVVVARESEIDFCQKEIVSHYGFEKVVSVCAGGMERYLSVYNGLKVLASHTDNEIVIVHDGARPFVTANMIDDVIVAAKEYGACAVGVPAKDTIKIVDEASFGIDTPDRNFVYQIQTPQAFSFDVLMDAYEAMFATENDGKYKITDDTMLVEQYKGVRSKIVLGSFENIKITTPEDMEIAEIFAKKIFEKF
ncbi:MAG: 2-C-methyl-D-erythritol 4-phosphate cytidylyltransferase [Eubacteriales bacterium]|nr:2-C-methyl-D-erythritol 4-phosphate cytidylyltransferase [Lachnospiraceae bacterium]MDO5126942.1 2-C-methyl-D-erythritol 4-phosphate cytidylyltransferase [Eubacteriales bacterium]